MDTAASTEGKMPIIPEHLQSLVQQQFNALETRQVPVSYTHLRAHETVLDIVCRLLLEKKKKTQTPTRIQLLTTKQTTHYTNKLVNTTTEQHK